MKKFLYYTFCLLTLVFFVSCSKSEDDPTKEKENAQYHGIILRDLTLPTTHLGTDPGKYTIYLPLDYKESNKKYPVLYLLHGMWSHNNEWAEKGGVVTQTTKAINNKVLGELIIVMPNAFDSFYVDGYDGKHDYESFFWQDLVPYIESNYPVKTGKENTAIAGLSMGGFGASYYAFKYPERFCMCYSMSGAVEGNGLQTDKILSVRSMFEKYGYNESNFSKLPAYFLDCGTQDQLVYSANLNAKNYLRTVNFPFTYRESLGTHDWNFWTAAYSRMLPDLGTYFK